VLTAEENERLVRVGKDTAFGRMARRFWIPICTSAQVAEPDGDPLRAKLLGEPFVVFRDTDGQVGVLNEFCMHRRVSLALGRVEDGGIRCLYHGWKFATDGKILETPNHCHDAFRKRAKAPAFPAREAGGVIWTYLGDPAEEPPFPHYSFMDVPDEHRSVVRVNVPTNWLQLFEGGVDSSHVGILHSNRANPSWMEDEFTPSDVDFNPGALAVSDNAPELEIEDTAFGYHYVAKRKGPATEDGSPTFSIRVTPVMLPFGRIIPAPAYQLGVFEVPLDDVSTAHYLIMYGDKPIDRAKFIELSGLASPHFWNDEDCNFRADWSDGLGQDRTQMKDNWTGFSGVGQEDYIMSVSMGEILDRTQEHVVAADRAVLHLRAKLLESMRLHEAGEEPIGAAVIDFTPIRALADTVIGTDERWQDHVPGNLMPSASAR
jgi:phthalate 4,5-dioxygenase